MSVFRFCLFLTTYLHSVYQKIQFLIIFMLNVLHKKLKVRLFAKNKIKCLDKRQKKKKIFKQFPNTQSHGNPFASIDKLLAFMCNFLKSYSL